MLCSTDAFESTSNFWGVARHRANVPSWSASISLPSAQSSCALAKLRSCHTIFPVFSSTARLHECRGAEDRENRVAGSQFCQGATALGGWQADTRRPGWHVGPVPGDSPEVRGAFEGIGAAEHLLDAAHAGGHAALPAG